ncbi:MAG: alpha/beta hydrolase [Rhodomicrobium sp.]
MNGEELQLLPVSAGSEGPVSIAYRFRKPKENRPTFVWFCGFKSEMESVKANALAAWARANGAGCLRFDYSGHGKSGGRFEDGTIGAWLDQAASVCRHVICDGPAVFVGSSMGGWVALLLARRFHMAATPHPVLLPQGEKERCGTVQSLNAGAARATTPPLPSRERAGVRGDLAPHLNGIVLIAPAWDMTRLFWERAPAETRESILRDGVYYRPSAYGDGPYAITKALIEDGERHLFGAGPVPLAVPIRILHGCQDPDVPWRRSLSLLDVIACPDMRLTLIKDGEHRLSRPGDLALLFTTLAEFF